MTTVDENNFAVFIDQHIRGLVNEVSRLKAFCLVLASEAEMYEIPFDFVHKTNPEDFDWENDSNSYKIIDKEYGRRAPESTEDPRPSAG